MDKYIDDNLTDLNILALLPEGVKISVRSGRIVHDDVNNAFNSFKRWIYNDNRKSGIQYIYNIVSDSLQILTETDNPAYKQIYLDILPNVIKGIENYKRTYMPDAFICSRCAVIVHNIETVLEKYN